MSIPTLTGLSASANTGTNYTDPATALQTVGRQPIPNYVQILRISPNGITFTNGTNVVAIPIQEAWNIAVTAGDIGLSYVPYIDVQPSPANVTHPAATAFQVHAISNELAPSYKWQNSTGGAFSNMSDGGVYSNTATNTLNISNSTGLNNNNFRCQVINTLGITISNPATLTVL